MSSEIALFTFPEQEQAMVEDYLKYQVVYDDLIKGLNADLKIRWEETFIEFLVGQHEVYRDSMNLLVFKEQGIPVAFLCYSEENEKIFVSYVFVDLAHRRRSIGRSLFDCLQRLHPAKSQHLICPRRQGAAEVFYPTLGFQRDPEGQLAKSLWFMKPPCPEVNDDLPRKYRLSPQSHRLD